MMESTLTKCCKYKIELVSRGFKVGYQNNEYRGNFGRMTE